MHDGLGLYVLLLFLSYFLIFNDLKIHWNDLCRMFRVGSTAAVDNQSEISFSITSSRDVAMASLPVFVCFHRRPGGSVAEWLACWTQVQKGLGSHRCRVSLRQTVHTHRASVHQAAKLVAALLRVVEVTAGLAECSGSLPPVL